MLRGTPPGPCASIARFVRPRSAQAPRLSLAKRGAPRSSVGARAGSRQGSRRPPARPAGSLQDRQPCGCARLSSFARRATNSCPPREAILCCRMISLSGSSTMPTGSQSAAGAGRRARAMDPSDASSLARRGPCRLLPREMVQPGTRICEPDRRPISPSLRTVAPARRGPASGKFFCTWRGDPCPLHERSRTCLARAVVPGSSRSLP